jgi:hypothetical protein
VFCSCLALASSSWKDPFAGSFGGIRVCRGRGFTEAAVPLDAFESLLGPVMLRYV